MVRMAAILAAVAAFVYAAVVGVQWLTPRIEQDVQTRVASALAEKGFMWADLKVQGRKVVIGGEAPDAATRDKALSTAARVFGVAMVEDRISLPGDVTVSGTAPEAPKMVETPKGATPYALSIVKEGDTVKLQGAVPDEQTKEVLVRIGETHYGPGKITADLKVEKGAPAGWRSAAGTVLFNIVNMEKANVTLSGTEVMLEAEVLDAEFATKAEKAIKDALPSAYKVGFAVDVVTPTEAKAMAEAEQAPAPVSPTAPAAKAEAAKADVKEAAKPITAKVAEAAAKPMQMAASAIKAAEAKLATIEPSAGPVAQEGAVAAGTETAGCADVDSIKKSRIYFGFDKADIQPKYKPTLVKVAEKVKACETSKVTVAGYTDTTGSKLYNKWLSQQRAEAAVRALMREGVEKDQLHAVGYGQTKAAASNKTREGRRQNRRVEFHPGSAFEAGSTEPKPHAVAPKAEMEETTSTAPATTKPSKGWWDSLGTLLNKGTSATVTTSATAQ